MRPVPTVASMERIWRVARVDKGVVRLLRDGGESVTGGSMTAPTLRDGTLPDVTGAHMTPAVGDRVRFDGAAAVLLPRSSCATRSGRPRGCRRSPPMSMSWR